MTKQEQNLLWLAGILFVGYVIPFQIAPLVWKESKQLLANIEKQKAEIARLHVLKSETDKWQREFELVSQQFQATESGLLSGETRALVSARAQSLLKEYAAHSKINLTSFELPEFVETGSWLLLTQSLKFEANSQQLMNFLLTLKQSTVKFWVVSLEVSVVGVNHVSGSLKVSAFSRKVHDEKETKDPKSEPKA